MTAWDRLSRVGGMAPWSSPPDIPLMKERKDYRGLTRALRHHDPRVQWKAAQALGELGEVSRDYLIGALGNTWNKEARIGMIEALGMIGDPGAVGVLVSQMSDRSNEIRWEAALALGEIGDPSAIPALRNALGDPDKYVRYGAALSLQKLSWIPDNEKDRAFYLAAMQEWDQIEGMGASAVEAVGNALRDTDRGVRIQAVRTMGLLRKTEAVPFLYRAIGDPDEEVRWHAVQAAPLCGLPMRYLPRALARRPRSRKNPLVAGFLNFVLPGMGYMYLGLWWGILVFQIDVYVTLLIFKATDRYTSLEVLFTAYFTLFSVYLVLAFHAWFVAKNMPDL